MLHVACCGAGACLAWCIQASVLGLHGLNGSGRGTENASKGEASTRVAVVSQVDMRFRS